VGLRRSVATADGIDYRVLPNSSAEAFIFAKNARRVHGTQRRLVESPGHPQQLAPLGRPTIRLARFYVATQSGVITRLHERP
jgi:hypothetical protein